MKRTCTKGRSWLKLRTAVKINLALFLFLAKNRNKAKLILTAVRSFSHERPLVQVRFMLKHLLSRAMFLKKPPATGLFVHQPKTDTESPAKCGAFSFLVVPIKISVQKLNLHLTQIKK